MDLDKWSPRRSNKIKKGPFILDTKKQVKKFGVAISTPQKLLIHIQ